MRIIWIGVLGLALAAGAQTPAAIAACDRGSAKMAQRDFAGAIAEFSAAIGLDKGYFSAYLLRGAAEADVRDYRAAEADATLALGAATAAGQKSVAVSNRANYELALGEYDAAEADLRQLPELGAGAGVEARIAAVERARNPNGPPALGASGDLQTATAAAADDPQRTEAAGLLKESQFLQALPLYRALAQRYPQDAEMLGDLGVCLSEVAPGLDAATAAAYRQEARLDLQQAQRMGNRSQMAALTLAGLNALAAGKGPQAPKTPVDEALAAADAAFARSDFAEAEQLWEKAAGLDPRSYEAALFAGDADYVMKKDDEAGVWFQKAIAINPGIETAYRYWGDALLQAGQPDAAREKYVEAVLANPYAPLAWNKGLAGWAGATHHVYGVPHIQPEMTSTIGANGQVNSKVAPGAGIAETGGTAWITYGTVRVGWYLKLYHDKYPEAKYYRHTLAEEDAALRALLAEVEKHKDKITRLEPQISMLQSLDADGVLDAFIVMSDADAGIAQDYQAYRAQHEDLLRRYLAMYVVHAPAAN